MRQLGLIGLVWVVGTSSPLWAAAANKASGCLIEPEQVADVGSPVTGVIERLQVNLGDTVKAGQSLVVLRADVERANVQVADTRSNVDAEAQAAQANFTLARQKVARTKQLLTQDFVSAQAVEQALAEEEVARQRHRLAIGQQRIYRQERGVAQAQLAMRTLRSPIDGIVVERYSNLGERVEDRPVIRVATINPLRVSLMVPMAQYGQMQVGQTMMIRPELPGAAPVQAMVNHVDKVVDAASNTFRVRLSLPNPENRLPGGLRCKAEPSMGAVAPASLAIPAGAKVSPRPQTKAPSPDTLALKTALSLNIDRLRLAHGKNAQRAPSLSPAPGPWLTASLTLSARH